MKKILVDLNILTNAFWKGDKKEIAKKFVEKVKAGEFEVYTPSPLIESIFDWKHTRLSKEILMFYSENSDILSLKTILKEFKKANVEYKAIVEELKGIGVKEEDAFLTLVASVFGLEIKTFNKIDLINRKDEINAILRKFRLKEVEISEPI